MNVLIHMGDSYPNETPAAKRMRTFSEALREQGHHVVVLVPQKDGALNTGENVRVCPSIKLKKKTTWMRMLHQVSYIFSSFFSAIGVGKVDIVLTTSPPALIGVAGWLIAKIKRAKLVYDVRDIWPDVAWEMGSFTKDSFFSKVFVFIRDFMLKHADLVTAVSPGKVEKLRAYAPKARVSLITNGLDESFLSNQYREEIVQKYGLKQEFCCVYIGNIGWAQGLMRLLKLAEYTVNSGIEARFLLFGDGVEKDTLEQYVQDHKLDNVVFAGRLPNADIYTVLRAADMSFVPLVNARLKDSVPTKLFEALGVGCPVLLSASGDATDILRESGLGIAVEPDDEQGLRDAFMRMYDHREVFVSKQDCARAYILDKYSRQNAARLLEKELQKLTQ